MSITSLSEGSRRIPGSFSQHLIGQTHENLTQEEENGRVAPETEVGESPDLGSEFHIRLGHTV